jgi:hypothetical protein
VNFFVHAIACTVDARVLESRDFPLRKLVDHAVLYNAVVIERARDATLAPRRPAPRARTRDQPWNSNNVISSPGALSSALVILFYASDHTMAVWKAERRTRCLGQQRYSDVLR